MLEELRTTVDAAFEPWAKSERVQELARRMFDANASNDAIQLREVLRAEGCTQRAILGALSSPLEPMRIGWVLEQLLGEPAGSFAHRYFERTGDWLTTPVDYHLTVVIHGDAPVEKIANGIHGALANLGIGGLNPRHSTTTTTRADGTEERSVELSVTIHNEIERGTQAIRDVLAEAAETTSIRQDWPR